MEKTNASSSNRIDNFLTRGIGLRAGLKEEKQHTIYLPPRLSKWLKLQAVEEDREISEIATDALEMYRKLHSS